MAKNKHLFICILCIFLVDLLLMLNLNEIKVTVQKMLNLSNSNFLQEFQAAVKGDVKIILLWNSYFAHKTWFLPMKTVGSNFFEFYNCSQTNCIITTDKNFLENVENYDAILFHGKYHMRLHDNLPKRRKPTQIYMYVNNESPANTVFGFRTPRFFNWTLTYHLNSDIANYYGSVMDLETGDIVAPNISPHWHPPAIVFQLDERTERLIAGKTKTIAWFVSNCNPKSKRDRLVKELRKYIDVDIYGKCGDLQCLEGSKDCDDLLNYNYKFYLSFENSLCEDYVTEKLFQTMEQTILPIVYGGANYSKFVPSYSYINVEDYKNVKELADYLLFLDKHPQEYRKYFWWKKFYKIEKHKHLFPFCDICLHLNEPSVTSKVQYYEDIEKWHSRMKCRKPKIKF